MPKLSANTVTLLDGIVRFYCRRNSRAWQQALKSMVVGFVSQAIASDWLKRKSGRGLSAQALKRDAQAYCSRSLPGCVRLDEAFNIGLGCQACGGLIFTSKADKRTSSKVIIV